MKLLNYAKKMGNLMVTIFTLFTKLIMTMA